MWLKKIKLVFGLLLALLCSLSIMFVLALIIIQNFYFTEVANFIVEKIQKNSAVKISCARFQGSLFTGKLMIDEVVLIKSASKFHNFKFNIGKVDLDFNVAKLLLATPTINKIMISNVQGTLELLAVENNDLPVDNKSLQFNIDKLDINNVHIVVDEKIKAIKAKKIILQLKELSIQPLSSATILQNILFDSQIAGSINEGNFSIKNDSLRVDWGVKYFPVELVGYYIGGAVSWMVDGSLNLDVTAIKNGNNLQMQWLIRIDELSTLGIPVAAINTLGSMFHLSSMPTLPSQIISNCNINAKKTDFNTIQELRKAAWLNELSTKILSSVSKV